MLIKFNFSILIVLLLINLLFSNCILEQSQNINEHDNDIISNQSPSSLQQKSDILLEKIEKELSSAVFLTEQECALDLISINLTNAYALTLELLGLSNDCDISQEIFSRFCVGK